MSIRSTATPQVRSTSSFLALAPRSAIAACVVLLGACGSGGDPSGQAPAAAVATPARPAPAPVAATDATADAEVPALPPDDTTDLIERAQRAMQEQRLFHPSGDNAFELFVVALEAGVEAGRARHALQDLFPYAVLNVEQRLAAKDESEATRLIGLMTRAQPDAPALPRLQRTLDALTLARSREAAAAAAASVAASATTVPAAPAPEPVRQPPSVPPPMVEDSGAMASTGPAAAAPAVASVPAPAMGAVSPAASQIQPTVTEAVVPPAAEPPMPKLLRQVPPRYPQAAGRRGTEGRVELGFIITREGRVADVQVLSSEPPGVFDRAAIDAVKEWRYEPGQADVRARRAIVFKLE